jgi:hypothetical protein
MRQTITAICAGCGAVNDGHRWSTDREVRRQVLGAPRASVQVRICSHCRRLPAGLPKGFLHLDGPFVPEHRSELEAVLREEVSRARKDQPFSALLDLEEDGRGGLIVTTSTEPLASRLGNALTAAFAGELHYGFSHENRLSHVWWHR